MKEIITYIGINKIKIVIDFELKKYFYQQRGCNLYDITIKDILDIVDVNLVKYENAPIYINVVSIYITLFLETLNRNGIEIINGRFIKYNDDIIPFSMVTIEKVKYYNYDIKL